MAREKQIREHIHTRMHLAQKTKMPPKTRRLRLPELRIQPVAGSLVLGTQILLIGTSPESPGACGYVQGRASEDEQDCFWRRINFFLRCHYLALWGGIIGNDMLFGGFFYES